MSWRNGWTMSDLNRIAWKVENLATLICMALILCTGLTVFSGLLFALTGNAEDGWNCVRGIAICAGLFAPTFLLSAYPDPVIRLYLRITAGPYIDTEETPS